MASFMINEAMTMFPSTSSLLSLYASFSTLSILLRNAYHEMVPRFLADYVSAKLRQLFSKPDPIQPDTTSIVIDNSWSYGPYNPNQLVEAVRFYLSTKIGPENKLFRVGKFEKKKRFVTALVGGETVVDVFDGDEMNWHLPPGKSTRRTGRLRGSTGLGLIEEGDGTGDDSYCSPDSCYLLTFQSRNRDKVLDHYLRHVYQVFEEMSPELQLFTWCWSESLYTGVWRSMESRHPKTFDTIAMDGELKKSIVDDLDRFVARRDFYKKNGDPWKRGYLLYGPPGTGKSSVVAAMSNHLKFNLYIMDLGNVRSDFELRHALLSIQNKSIVVFEDIDCCPELHARSDPDGDDESTDQNGTNDKDPRHLKRKSRAKFTLSTMLNCIDGIWSSHGEERIIIFTTNHKEVLDPALIRPGRMDMHIHLSNCTPEAFRGLASIYLEVKGDHPLLEEIDGLLQSVEVTPAALAEELRKGSDDVDAILQQVVDFLNQKKKKKKKKLLGKGKAEPDGGQHKSE